MIKIIKIGIITISSQLPFIALAATQELNLTRDVAYVHTVRNEPTFKTEKSSGKLKKGDIISPTNFEIKCESNQKAFLVFSNRNVLEVMPNSDINIETYDVAKNEKFTFLDEEEKSRSITKITLTSGKLLSFGLKPRPTSLLKITTPYGSFDIKSSRFILSLDKKNLSISILNGRAIFKEKNGKEYFIKDQQRGLISFEDDRRSGIMQIDYITNVENDSIKERLNQCKMAFETTEFVFSEDGKVSVNRIISKEFLNRLAK